MVNEKCALRDGVAPHAVLAGYESGWSHWALYCPIKRQYPAQLIAKPCLDYQATVCKGEGDGP